MADGEDPPTSNLNLAPESGHVEPSAGLTTNTRALGHGGMQTIGNLLGRNQRSLAALAMPSLRPESPMPAAGAPRAANELAADHQASAAIAARLSSPTPNSDTVNSAAQDESERSVRHQLGHYVNLELVRDLIVRHSIELAVVLVILIYLVYYFSRISRRPKLIGNKQSDFVASISRNFKQTLRSRFSPLVYFWGTNPQTALFGYLQGQSSDDEMPRSKFHRQYLYVSDAQYLASNIDLNDYYEKCARRSHFSHRLCLDQLILEEEEERAGDGGGQCERRETGAVKGRQLSQNIRFVIGQQLEAATGKPARRPLESVHTYHSEGEDEELSKINAREGGGSESGTQRGAVKLNRMLTRTTSADCSNSSAIGSSSDSGVFAHCETSSANSSSSGSSLTIDMVSTPRTGPSKSSRSSSTMSSGSGTGRNNKCSCVCLYESKLDDLTLSPAQNHQHSNPLAATAKRTRVKREHFEFGQCALDWHLDSHEHYHNNKSVALISAGMTTGSDKKYVTDTVQTLNKLGYEVCVFIRRGVGGLKLNSAKFFSPSKWHDFEAAILSIKRQRPACRLVAIGFSFGSIELCRYLSMSGDRSLVASALLISCPFDPEAGGRNMRKRALNRKIDAYLAKNLGKQLHQALLFNNSTSEPCPDSERAVLENGVGGLRNGKSTTSGEPDKQRGNTADSHHFVHENYNGSLVDLSCLPKIKSLVDFEDNYNRVIQNYPTSDAYGADSRLNEQLAQIKTPTLCLSSEDDFMAPVKLLPIKQIEANENLCMILTKRGGHMAFIDGLLWPKKPYFAQRIIEEYMKLAPKVDDTKNIIIDAHAASKEQSSNF